MIDKDTYELRKYALDVAQAYLEPIIEKFPPEQYSDKLTPTPMFTAPTTNTVTQAEQIVNLMITIADWLIQKE